MLWRPHTVQVPDIRTPLPGPKAKQLIELDAQFASPSYTRMYPLVAARGEGATIVDIDGNSFLDFTAGIAVCSTGHCHPQVVQAIQRQAAQLIHMSGTDFYYEPQIKLAQKLAEIAPGASPKKVLFTNSGAESVEAAMKLARYATGRPHFIGFFGAFHGRTLGALSMTASKVVQRRGFAPLLPHVSHVEYPQARKFGDNAEAAIHATLQQIENLFARTVPADDVAAIVIEPIQGEGGYLVPPENFHRQLQALAKQHGILYVVDEVQSGMGRTGRMFASEHFGIEPDILCTAKGIASGLPLGAIIAKAELMTWPPGSQASTFGGNPVSCVAALETIDLLQKELIGNATYVGNYLQLKLRELQEKHAVIGEIRGLGLMIGMELVQDRNTFEPHVSACQQLIQKCFERGLLLLSCGRSTIRFCPPLLIDHADVDIATNIIDLALQDMARNKLV
jgi:4-aminobutyrate aminotransferase